jgi:MFS superfamily sulfate permease-like transporter
MKFNTIKSDIPASLVVFLVALPLCMGIALGSGAPVISGLIAGIIGGVVVGYLSGSSLSVSGPAAGLIATVSAGIVNIGSFEAFLVSVIIAGFLQILFGLCKAGVIGHFIPNAVIKGLLVAIGLLLIFKQIPHLLGYDADFEGDESFFQKDGENTFSELLSALNHFAPLAIFLGILGLLIQFIWDPALKKINANPKWLPAPLIVVLLGGTINYFVSKYIPQWKLENEHLVNIPDINAVISDWKLPVLNAFFDSKVWLLGFSIAVIASIETLLSIEATDKLDPAYQITPTNRELIAQGVGNIFSGILGGLPVTAVIVRSSANINAGGKSKLSAIIHGMLLALTVWLIPGLLSKIPLASLASILIFVGYKLAKPSIFSEQKSKGINNFLPFLITVTAIMLSDLLIGVSIGLLVSIVFIFRSNYRRHIIAVSIENHHLVRFIGEVTFFNKSVIKEHLEKVNSYDKGIVFDYTRCTFIDVDIRESVIEFCSSGVNQSLRIEHKFQNEEQKRILLKDDYARIH